MKTLFAPGCALNRYKPDLISRLSRFLQGKGIVDGIYLTCCKSEHSVEGEVRWITCCPGCSYRFQKLFPDAPVVSLWSVLPDAGFPLPDYRGERMSIHDACHARNRNSTEMQDSVRRLCGGMNIELVEPARTRDGAACCGGSAGDYETRRRMAVRRAGEFPEKDVVVYCTGCARSFSVTDVAPRHILDLLFCEPTEGLYPPRD